MTRAFGTHRTVWLTQRYAIKIPVFVEWRLFLLGLLANMQEARFSKTEWPELCPVVFACWGGFFSVMLRAERLSSDKFFEYFPSESAFDAWRDGGNYIVPVEYKPDSVGILDGTLVAVDYGS